MTAASENDHGPSLQTETLATPSQKNRFPLVTTRVGIIFLAVAVCVLACAVTSKAAPTQPRLHSMMWTAALAACTLGGLIAMSSVRTLRVIEKELRSAQQGQRQWQTARPVVGADPITIGWNQLLEDVAHYQQGEQEPRIPAALDQEVVTLRERCAGCPLPGSSRMPLVAFGFSGPRHADC